jgi:carboxypeptidase family protein
VCAYKWLAEKLSRAPARGPICGAVFLAAALCHGCAHSPKLSETGTLMGKVTDEQGNAVAGARVCLEGISVEPVTRLDGSFQLPKLLAGRYNVIVKVASYNSRFKEGVRIEGGRVTEVKLVMAEPPQPPRVAPVSPPETRVGTIRGQVVDENGHEIQYANVMVINTSRGAQTDSKGRFLILGVPIGTHTVRVRMVGFGEDNRKQVQVSEGDTTTVDFKLHAVPVKLRYFEVRE